MENNQTIGEKLAALRKARGLTQADVGAFLNISYQAVSKWERNESCPDFATLSKLAQFFGVPISYFENGGAAFATTATTAATEAGFGVSAAVAASPVAVGAADENAKFDVVLKDIGPNRIAVVKVVRDATGLAFFDAVETVDSKGVIKQSLSKTDAEALAAQLRENGAMAELVGYSEAKEKQRREEKRKKNAKAKNRGLIWGGIAAGIVFILGFFGGWKSALGTLAFDLFLFSFIAQLFWDGAVVDLVTHGGEVVGTPGVIFSFDLDGFIFLIGMKILFAVLRFLIYILTLLFFVALAMFIAPFTFVPALIRVNKEGV